MLLKTKKQKIVAAVTAVFLIVAAGGFLFLRPVLTHAKSAGTASLFSGAAIPGGKKLVKEKIQADAKQLVSIVESTHPAFVLKEVPANYQSAKKEFLSAASSDMTVDNFDWLANQYLVSLGDGHTHTNSGIPTSGKRLDIAWKANGRNLFLLDKNGRLTNQQVTEIDGIPVRKIFQTISQQFAAENDTAVQFNYSQYSLYQSVLLRAGVPCVSEQIPVTVKAGGKTSVKKVSFTNKPNPYAYDSSGPFISCKVIGDVFYIDFNECDTGQELDKTVSQLIQALANGVTKVIIDVRNNPGGNSQACTTLLDAMKMKPPVYGGVICFSPLVKQQRPEYSRQDGYDTFPPDISAAKPYPSISLVVLTNETTFSSATMLGVFVQDGKLGKIIGAPSINSPNCFGDVLAFQLTNTHIRGQISFKQWIRPDVHADPKTLKPDIVSPDGEDSLQTALNYLKSKETAAQK